MPRSIKEDPAGKSDGLRTLEAFRQKLEKDFPGISDPAAEIVLTPEKTEVIPKPISSDQPSKKAS